MYTVFTPAISQLEPGCTPCDARIELLDTPSAGKQCKTRRTIYQMFLM
jgi:hypothetical protein